MDDKKKQQLEALEVAIPYCNKIEHAINTVCEEYNSQVQPDTEEFMNHINNGINWIIQVFNGTKDLVNQNHIVVDKEKVNQSILDLNQSYQDNDTELRVHALKEIALFIGTFRQEAESLCKQA